MKRDFAAERAAATIKWIVPPESTRHANLAMRHKLMRMAIRSCAAAAVALFLMRYMLERYAPQFPWDLFLWIGSLLPLVQFLPSVLMLSVQRDQQPGEYAIIADGILAPSGEHPLLRWTSLDSFTIEPHPGLRDLTELHLHRKSGGCRRLTLPADAPLAAIVLAEVQSRLAQRPPLPLYSPLIRRDWLIGFSLLVAYTAGVSALLAGRMRTFKGHIEVLQLLLLLIGPGTLIAPFLWRRRATIPVFTMALMLNFIGMIAALATAAMLYLTRR